MVDSLAIGAVYGRKLVLPRWELILPRRKLILSVVSFKPRSIKDGALGHE